MQEAAGNAVHGHKYYLIKNTPEYVQYLLMNIYKGNGEPLL